MQKFSKKLRFRICAVFGAIALFASAFQVYAASKAEIILGDYDKEPRVNGRVDTDRLVQRLSQLNANTYMYLVGHGANDWQDLMIFLPKAEKANIAVWVYLLPPSETPNQDKKFHYSEPYRLDYVKWAQSIAALSLKYPNVKGYVIDDFWRNIVANKDVHSIRFTPSYIKKMVDAGKEINPKIKFFPLMYFTHQMDTEAFTEIWAPMLDGVVAAYPSGVPDVEAVLRHLDGRGGKYLPMIVMVSGDESTLVKFNHIAGTPKNIAGGADAMTKLARKGVIDGVVTYCLDLSDESANFDAIKEIYKK